MIMHFMNLCCHSFGLHTDCLLRRLQLETTKRCLLVPSRTVAMKLAIRSGLCDDPPAEAARGIPVLGLLRMVA